MTLLNPAGLWFAALVPVIVLLYLLRLRRQPARVSTLMFWQRVVANDRRRAWFQRLRQVLSLLLHLLIFALLLLALARLEFRSFRGTEEGLNTVVIVDCRARMQTLAGSGGTRFGAAVRIAEGYLRRASNRQPMALLALAGAPRVVCGSTGDERALLDALAGLQATAAGGRVEDAVGFARQMLAAGKGARRVVLITDQPIPSGAEARAAVRGAPVTVETRLAGVDGALQNVGIVRLDARPLPGSPDTDEVLVEIENFGRQRQAGDVELTFEGRPLDVKPFDLAPGERRTDVYPALAARTGIANPRGWLSARLALKSGAGDALALDNNAYAVIPPPRPVRVLLVTRGDWFLESLLKADDGVQFDQLSPEAFQPAQAAGFDCVVLDSFLPPGFERGSQTLPPGNFLFVDCAPPPLSTNGPPAALAHPPITDIDTASPLLRRVNLRDVTILRAQTWALPEANASADGWVYTAPVRSFEHPLVVTGERRPSGGTARSDRMVSLAFGVADSDLPLRIAFPLFMHNTLAWLAARNTSAESSDPIGAGQTIQIPRGAQLWTRPQVSYAPIGRIPAPELIAGPGAFQPLANGFYLLRTAGGADRWLAVDTLDRTMSAVNAPAQTHIAAAPAPGASQPVVAGERWELLRVWPPWMELALLAFVLCTLEWWGFHRRRTE